MTAPGMINMTTSIIKVTSRVMIKVTATDMIKVATLRGCNIAANLLEPNIKPGLQPVYRCTECSGTLDLVE